MKFSKSDGGQLIRYLDADWGGDADDSHSTTGSLFLLAGEALRANGKLLLHSLPVKLNILL